jgi:hypothetical protein
VLALVLATAGCGGSGGGEGVASADGAKSSSKAAAPKKKDPQQAGLDFARCMREHGVDVPDPQPGEGGFIRVGPGPADGGTLAEPAFDPAFEEADKACRHFLEDLIPHGAGPADPEEQDRALKFSQCMREHGVNMPDPEFQGGGISVKIEGVDPTSESFKEAQKACGDLFGPKGGPGVAVRPGGGQPA